MEKIPGILPAILEAGRVGNEKPLVVNVRGEDIALLKKYAAELKEEIYKIPGIVDLEVTLEQDIPEFRLIVDRERAVDAGVMTGDIVRTVGALVGGQAVTTYEDEDGDAVNVRVRLPLALRQDPAQVERLRLAVPKPSALPALVPLGNVVNYGMSTTPSEINRQDLTRQVVITANLDDLPLGTAVKKVEEAAKHLTMAPGYRIVFSGEAEDMAESFGYMAEALILADHLRLPHPGGPVRVLHRPAGHHVLSAPFDRGHGRHALSHPGHDQHHVPHRAHHAHGIGHQERHPAGGFYQDPALPGDEPAGSPDHRRAGRDCGPS